MYVQKGTEKEEKGRAISKLQTRPNHPCFIYYDDMMMITNGPGGFSFSREVETEEGDVQLMIGKLIQIPIGIMLNEGILRIIHRILEYEE